MSLKKPLSSQAVKDFAEGAKVKIFATVENPESAPENLRTKTVPGKKSGYVAQTHSELFKENNALRKSLEDLSGSRAVQPIDPKEIRRSKYANRHQLNFDDNDFAALRAEIAAAGSNVQPIKVRPVRLVKDSPIKYEIIFGHRRHEACRLEEIPVLAIIDPIDDKTLFVQMDRENRARKNLTPWEQGMMYKNAIDQGLFLSNKKMSVALGVDVGNVGKAIALAKIPSEIVAAFNSPFDLQYRWSKHLSDAIATDQTAVFARAKEMQLNEHRPSPIEIVAFLIGKNKKEKEGCTVQPPSITIGNPERLQVTFLTGKKGTVIEFNEILSDVEQQQMIQMFRAIYK